MDQNKLRKLAGLPVIFENLRNNANFQSRMLEKFENAKDHFGEIRKFINSSDFDKFLELYNEEAEQNHSANLSIVDIAGELAENLENAEAIMGKIHQVCSKANSASS